jgi:hypothetical protein
MVRPAWVSAAETVYIDRRIGLFRFELLALDGNPAGNMGLESWAAAGGQTLSVDSCPARRTDQIQGRCNFGHDYLYTLGGPELVI